MVQLMTRAASDLEDNARSLALHMKMLEMQNGGYLLDLERRVNEHIEPLGWKLVKVGKAAVNSQGEI